MRKVKKRTTQLVHLIEHTWAVTKKGQCIQTQEQIEVITAIDGTLYFLEMFDEMRGEKHKTYFIKKYLSLRNNMSQAQLSSEYCICRDSVSSYCAMYLKIFESTLKAVKIMPCMSSEQTIIIKSLLADLSLAAVQNRKKQPILHRDIIL